MSSKKILVVFGATGNQGGSVIRSILDDPTMTAEFQVHAVTRDPAKPAAAALAEKGITVLKADLDDRDSLRLAMKDAYAVFAVTNWHEIMTTELAGDAAKEHEIQQGKNIADIAKELNVQHLIWSSLPNVSKLSNGAFTKVIHFDSKAIVEEYIRTLNIPATFLLLGVFMNYLGFMLDPVSPTQPSTKKSYKLTAPILSTCKIPLISVATSVGVYVKAILHSRSEVLDKQICAAEKWYSLDEAIVIMQEEGGLDVVFEKCTAAEHMAFLAKRGLPDFFQEDMSQNMRWCADWGFFGGADGVLEEGHKILSEPLETFSEWVNGGGLDFLK